MQFLDNIHLRHSESRFAAGFEGDEAARRFFSAAGIRAVIRTDAPFIRVIRILSDCYLLVIVVLAAFALFDGALKDTPSLWKAVDATIFIGATLAALYLFGIYDTGKEMPPLETIYRTAKSISLSMALSLTAYYLFTHRGIQVIPTIAMGSLAWVTVSAWHGISQRVLSCFSEPLKVLIVSGNDDESEELAHGIKTGTSSAHRLAGRIALKTTGSTSDADVIKGIKDEVARLKPDLIAVADSFEAADNHKDFVLKEMPGAALKVVRQSCLYETVFGKVSMSQAVFLPAFRRYRGSLYRFAKRTLDMSVSVVGILFILIIFVPVAVAVKASSPGPVFFSQKRRGRKGKVFKLIKFRTMRTDPEGGAVKWPGEDSGRVTPAGSFLRRTRLDEVPQFLNVLKGDLALVGPRPERPELEKLIGEELPLFKLRHLAKPGLTGWAQVKGGYPSGLDDMREKLQYDLFYIKNRCFFLDLVILLKTAKAIFQFKGK